MYLILADIHHHVQLSLNIHNMLSNVYGLGNKYSFVKGSWCSNAQKRLLWQDCSASGKSLGAPIRIQMQLQIYSTRSVHIDYVYPIAIRGNNYIDCRLIVNCLLSIAYCLLVNSLCVTFLPKYLHPSQFPLCVRTWGRLIAPGIGWAIAIQ